MTLSFPPLPLLSSSPFNSQLIAQSEIDELNAGVDKLNERLKEMRNSFEDQMKKEEMRRTERMEERRQKFEEEKDKVERQIKELNRKIEFAFCDFERKKGEIETGHLEGITEMEGE
jgi:ElaB/YqjD/DUF883 family membrane-anchored ribosome-binding protein